MKKADRQKVFDKFGGKCAYCGCDLENGWHVDHFKSVGRQLARHPTTHRIITTNQMDRPENDCLENLMPSCPSCNRQKSSMDVEAFREIIGGFVNSLNRYTNQYKFAKRYGLIQETNKPVVFFFEQLNALQPNQTNTNQ